MTSSFQRFGGDIAITKSGTHYKIILRFEMIKYEVEVDEQATFWKLNGKLHREAGPAVEYANGTKEWFLGGKCHREDGPAIEYADGTKLWYRNGSLHREDGPAIECASGSKYWYLDGIRHRTDGPAIEWSNGCKEWFLNGTYMSKQEWNDRMNPVKEMTVLEIQEALGYKIKVVE